MQCLITEIVVSITSSLGLSFHKFIPMIFLNESNIMEPFFQDSHIYIIINKKKSFFINHLIKYFLPFI